MSDVSQGPGWWMASDHKWYPPEAHAGYQPAPPPPPPAPPLAPGYYPGGAPPYPYAMAPVSVGPVLAGYGQRLGGWLIDWLILLAVCVPISIVTHSFHYTHTATQINGFGSNGGTFRWGMPGQLISPLIVIIYGTAMCGSGRAQTLGMMVAGTKALKVSTGAPIGYAAALWRATFEMILAAALFLPWVLDVLFPLWDPKNQTLHDKVSSTVVVRTPRP
jgi:uncharacterized RDD family membrane protein YckC